MLSGMDKQRENGALLIAACIVAAIRLRGEPIRPSPKLTATVQDSVELAKMVLREGCGAEKPGMRMRAEALIRIAAVQSRAHA